MASEMRSGSGIRLCCPTCGALLEAREDSLLCRACGRRHRRREGIGSFTEDAGEAAGEAGPRFEEVARDVREHGWRVTAHRLLARGSPDTHEEVFLPRLADWFYLGDVERRELAVDLEAGRGGLAMRLAGLFDHVVAVEQAWDRVKFAEMLFRHEGVANATLVHAEADALPLAEGSFDLVVLGEGFTRAALRGKEADAERAQRGMLEKARRLLRPGGSLFLMVTNRFAPGCLTGRRDHGRPPWAGVLPPSLGKLYGRLWREPERHALTHSPAGYRRLLESAGLTEVRVHAAFPSCRDPRVIVPLADPGKLAWAVRLSLGRRAKKLGLGSRMAHRLAGCACIARAASRFSGSLILCARRPAAGAEESLEPGRAAAAASSGSVPAQRGGLLREFRERVGDEWAELGLGGPRPASISVVQMSGNWDEGGKVNWFVFPGRSQRAALVARMARTRSGAGRIEHEHEVLRRLRSLGSEVSDHIPRPVARWEIEGHAVVIQEYTPWPPLRRELGRMPPGEAIAHALGKVMPFLTQLAAETRRDLPGEAEHPYLKGLVEEARKASRDPEYAEEVQEVCAGLAEVVRRGHGVVRFTVAHHHDLNATDLLVSGEKFVVLDWEWAAEEGLPLLDLMALGISAASVHGASAVAEATRALAGLPLDPRSPFRAAADLARSYCASVGLDEKALAPLAAAAVLHPIVRVRDSCVSSRRFTAPDDDEAVLVAGRALLRAATGEAGSRGG